MSLVTDTGKFTKQLDLAMGTSVASASTVDVGATDGNTVIVLGTTTITSLGTAPQAGTTRTLIFADALILTHSANLVLFGDANITTVLGDRAVFTATSTGIWEMVAFFRKNAYTNGLINEFGIADGAIVKEKLGDACVVPSKQMIREVVNMADSDSALSSSQMVLKGIFISNNTSNWLRTVATASNIIGQLYSYQVGTAFDFTVIAKQAFNDTITANTGVTLVGDMTVNNESAVFMCVVTSPTTVTIYRKS